MSQVMTQQATPLDTVPELEEGIIEKLVAAGVTTVEQVADMTPEQLEEIPGVGPKTVEKISIAVNNYFSSLEAPAEGEAVTGDEAPTADEVVAAEEDAAKEDEEAVAAESEGEGEADAEGEIEAAAEESGDLEGLSTEPEAADESVQELVDEGQYYEAEVVDGVENAPPADVAEVHTHERPVVEGESLPDEEQPGEQR